MAGPSGQPRAAGAALEVRGLSVAYGHHAPVLHSVDLAVAPGQTFALLGANGAGKTTLLRAVTGLLAHHGGRVLEGDIRVDDVSVVRERPAARVRAGLAQSMEGRRVFGDLSVVENLQLGAHVRRGRSDIAEDLEGVFERFPELADRRKTQAGYLSGGQQQMLAIGRALMARPRVLVLDEPSLGLAPQLVARVAGIISGLADDGMTVLLIEQNVALALQLADRACVLELGRVVVAGTADELRDDDAVRSAYLGGTGAEAGVAAAALDAFDTAP
jgi:branched-chain amino acid transport system ATP-binding protein